MLKFLLNSNSNYLRPTAQCFNTYLSCHFTQIRSLYQQFTFKQHRSNAGVHLKYYRLGSRCDSGPLFSFKDFTDHHTYFVYIYSSFMTSFKPKKFPKNTPKFSNLCMSICPAMSWLSQTSNCCHYFNTVSEKPFSVYKSIFKLFHSTTGHNTVWMPFYWNSGKLSLLIIVKQWEF